ncbi:MAG: phosphoglucosamine mutase [Phycisphaerae bacterium]|nr:phosphoglucosamine mutase [Phycisphaerae bacterium]NIR66784.1 phosphoglucosamine mutase [candidate division Zixibacteria bacterium]NIP52653.1 phosphoglucosamine mutase [Phycisphaerae bacterium]NIS49858.1 phosphoglucosamine mutase [Phycisphaerae bacterium]NIU07951.1 phosphoglucosamine mutase [Phycisphaerae bacterium]
MTEELIISISGMRGIVGENLTYSIATEYGCAFGSFLKNKAGDNREKLSVCIGRDSRPSGEMLKSAVAEGLCRVGIDVIDLGLVTTPCVGIMVRELGCTGGVVVTASHNPAQYNGIKLLLDNGIAPPPDEAKQIKKYFYDKQFTLVDSDDYGKVTSNEQTDTIHIAKVLAIVDKNVISQRKFNILLDSINGAGGRVTKKLLAEFGCMVTAINDEPSGIFAHVPEPTAENLTGLCEAVKAERADIGFAQDPDADRLAIVDENGTYIGEEYTLALAAKYIFSRKTGKAATNLSTSRMLDDVAEEAGGQVVRTPVGEANVAAAMLEHDCIIGGEGNGGVIDLRVSPVRDSLVGIALVLQLMSETGKSISELVSKIGGYYMSKDKFTADKSQAQQILDSAKEAFADAGLNTADGCRFDFDDGWLHLRSSNTEPVMRIIVEAKDQPTAQKYIDAVLDIRKRVLG